MPLVTQSIKNLKGGISQQPDVLRFPDQGQEQVNGFSSEVQGLQKRPPTVHIKRLGDTYGEGDPFVKLINRDEFEQYYVVARPGDGSIWVFDLDGNTKTVNAPDGWNYLTTPNPRADIRAVTVADYTFIINRRIEVTPHYAGGPTHGGYREDAQFLISIKGGQYGRKYRVVLNGNEVAQYETPDGTDPTHSKQISTQHIAQKLFDAMVASLGPSGWIIIIGPNWVQGFHPSQSATSLSTEDGFNNVNMQGIIFDVQRFNMLPAQGPDKYIVRVAGDPGSGSDDYYVQYDAATATWRETTKPGIYVGNRASTMPHVLIREADGTFTFRAAEWAFRTAGDDDSNPLPSFTGNTISDVFFFRNRLGLISGENVILSGSGDFFNFFPRSVVASPDTDPIDVAVSHNRVSMLNHAVPFNEELLLWSDQSQFVLRSDGVLSPRSVRVDQSTEFASAITARPVPAGRSVYFAAPRATYTSIRRYYTVLDVTTGKNADDISAHVPSYIPNGVFFLGSSTTENVVTVLTSGAPNRIYLYKYLYLEEQLVQQSWSHWEFGGNDRILAADFIGPVMYVMRSSPGGTFLESVEFTQNTKDIPQEPYRVFVDGKVWTNTAQYDEATNQSWIDIFPLYGYYGAGEGNWWLVRDDGRAFYLEAPEGGWPSDPKFRMLGDQRGRGFTIGRAYSFRYVFSRFLIKVTDQSGTRSEDVGRLQIRRAWVNYEESGPFTVSVCDRFRYTMSGKKLGTMYLGAPAADTGQFRFPVMYNATECSIQIESDDPTPVAIIGAGWNGMYWRREQPI